MAASVTLLALRTRARQYADQENSTFVTDAELTDYVNQGVRELYDLLIAAYGAGYYTATTTFSSAASINLPATFYKLEGLWKLDTNSKPIAELHSFQESQRVEVANFLNNGYPRYRLKTATIELLPVPVPVFTIQCNFIPVATALVADGDVFDGINGWEDHAVLSAAIRMSMKEDEQQKVASLSAMKAVQATRIDEVKRARQVNEPPATVRDLDSSYYQDAWPYGPWQ